MSEERDTDNVVHVDFGGGKRKQQPARPPQASAHAPAEAERHDPLAGLYTLQEAARLFDFKAPRLRYWDRSGLLQPSAEREGRRYYTFQDLIGIRAAKDLLEQGVSMQRVRRTVESLRDTLPRVTRPLAELRIRADGNSVLVQDEAGAYEPSTGQVVLDFSVDSLKSQVIRMLQVADDDRETAYEYYLQGCRLDEDQETFAQAEEAYRRALELDPTLANAHTNLGNLAYRQDRLDEAERHYRGALQIDARQPEASYNLGFIHFERGEVTAAIARFQEAIKHDPNFADAHFNLAMAHEESGDHAQAVVCWRKYLELEPAGAWAQIAREHLRRPN